MASPSELRLDYNPNTYPLIQKPLGGQPEQTHKLEDFLALLEEEKLKIEAFKRELPLCMQLLNNAMETYRRQLETYQSNNQEAKPVLEEFIPITNMSINGSEKPSTAHNEKANWMVSAQLWSRSSDHQAKQQPLSTKLALDTKHRNGGGGAFLPFSKEKINKKVPDLWLSSGEKEIIAEKKILEINSDGVVTKSVTSHEQQGRGGSHNNTTNEGQEGGGGHRKARRCWSPDLHRRFVNALQMLGGSQATPKQIRELMKVDGLTNDEVKSHLQKYRLHTRRPIQQPQPPPAAAPQLVVLGGIWVPPEYATAAAASTIGPAIYGAPTHYSLPHDFYASHQPPPHHHHHLHRTTAVPYKARVRSPDSGLGSGGDLSESIEEGQEGEERGAEEEEDEEEGEEGEEIIGDQEMKMDVNDHDVVSTENNGLTLA